MSPEEYKWNVDLIKDRYHYLKPTFGQAEKIYQYEQEKLVFPAEGYFTEWEELDYELSVFTKFLNTKQLIKYEQFRKDNLERLEQGLIDADNSRETSIELSYLEAELNFCENQIFPALFEDSFLLNLSWLENERPKMEYLKSEYKQYLGKNKLAIIISHFRNYRTFQPNTLQLSLLRHRLSYILPDYFSFKHKLDDPAKSVIKHLSSKLNHLPEDLESFLDKKFQELRAFNEKNYKKHYGKQKGGFVINLTITPEEEKEHRAMFLVLLDKNKYDLAGSL